MFGVDDSSRIRAIQAQINADVRAFSAFTDLGHACSQLDSRRRWIHATTAAERAIKEFLSRSKPGLASLLSKLLTAGRNDHLSDLFGHAA